MSLAAGTPGRNDSICASMSAARLVSRVSLRPKAPGSAGMRALVAVRGDGMGFVTAGTHLASSQRDTHARPALLGPRGLLRHRLRTRLHKMRDGGPDVCINRALDVCGSAQVTE